MKKEILILLLIIPLVYAHEQEASISNTLLWANIIFALYLVCCSLNRKSYKKVAATIAVVAIISYLGYSTWLYQHSQVEQEGITVCEGEVCKWSAHWHAQLEIKICGKEYSLPLEKGDLDGPHTHKEYNRIHWHSILNADTETKLPLDLTPFTLKSFFKSMNLRFDQECLGNYCSGMKCNGKTGKLKMQVNGRDSEAYEKYIWKDEDEIKLEMR